MSYKKLVILVRHGESQTNASEVFQAGNQVEHDPLTDKGRRDAQALAKRLAHLKIEALLSSSYLRARQTAEAINQVAQAPHIVPIVTGRGVEDRPADDPELRRHISLLREIDLPSGLAGLSFHDPEAIRIREAMKRTHQLRRKVLPLRSHYSDEENIYDIWQRAKMISRYLERRQEKTIVVVAHGGILKVWLAHILFGEEEGVKDRLIRPAILKGYIRYAKHSWWDNTGLVAVPYTTDAGWRPPIANIDHLKPLIPNVMSHQKAADELTDDEASEFLES